MIVIGIIASVLSIIMLLVSFHKESVRDGEQHFYLIACALYLICAAICFKSPAIEYKTKSCGQNIAIISADGKSATSIPYCS